MITLQTSSPNVAGRVITEILGLLVALFGDPRVRLIIGIAAGGVLAYWTLERLLGQGEDPTMRYSSRSEAGSSSYLISGIHAVGMAAIVAWLMLAPLAGRGMLISLLLLVLVGVHWVYEKEEREEDGGL